MDCKVRKRSIQERRGCANGCHSHCVCVCVVLTYEECVWLVMSNIMPNSLRAVGEFVGGQTVVSTEIKNHHHRTTETHTQTSVSSDPKCLCLIVTAVGCLKVSEASFKFICSPQTNLNLSLSRVCMSRIL